MSIKKVSRSLIIALTTLSGAYASNNMPKDTHCYIDKYDTQNGDWQVILSIYCDKEVNLSKNTIIIETKDLTTLRDENNKPYMFPGEISDISSQTALLERKISGNQAIINFETSNKAKSQLDQRLIEIEKIKNEMNSDEMSATKSRYESIKDDLAAYDDQIFTDESKTKYNPMTLEERNNLLDAKSRLIEENNVLPYLTLVQRLEIAERLRDIGSDVIMPPMTPQLITVSSYSKPYADGHSLAKFSIGGNQFDTEAKPLEYEEVTFDRENFINNPITTDNGIVRVLSNAAKTDPIISKRIKITDSMNDYNIAKAYYNMLFFPKQEDYPELASNDSFLEYKLRKSGCGSRKVNSRYNGCDVYFSFDNLVDAYVLGYKKFEIDTQGKKALFKSENEQSKYSKFANTGNALDDKRHIAAFFANIAQETGGGSFQSRFEGITYSFSTIVETPCDQAQGICGRYGTHQNDPLIEFYGRGGKQLSYPYNYKFYSKAIFDDFRLYDDPELMVYRSDKTDGINSNRPGMYGFATSLAYMLVNYTDSCEPGSGVTCDPNEYKNYVKPTMTDALSTDWKNIDLVRYSKKTTVGESEASGDINFGEYGFGQTINVINGGVECLDKVHENNLSRISGYVELLLRFDAGVEKVTYNVIGDDEVHTITKSQLLQNLKNDNPIKFNITWAPKHDPIMNNSPLMQSKVVSDYSEDEIGLDKLAISRIDLHYDNGVSERLDCVGYDRYNK